MLKLSKCRLILAKFCVGSRTLPEFRPNLPKLAGPGEMYAKPEGSPQNPRGLHFRGRRPLHRASLLVSARSCASRPPSAQPRAPGDHPEHRERVRHGSVGPVLLPVPLDEGLVRERGGEEDESDYMEKTLFF